MDVPITGCNLDYAVIVNAIEKTGAVVHSIDELVAGERMVERIPKSR